MAKDYYAILGVQKHASADEIKKAFRRLAHEHHPDKGGNSAKFKDINEAYQILGDAKKRATYDQFGSQAFDGTGNASGPGGFGGGFQGFDFNGGFDPNEFGDLGDVLGQMFGMGGRGSARGSSHGGKPRGEDIHLDVYLSFRESAFGVTKPVHVYHHVACHVCKGDGAETGSKRKSCDACKGSGQTREARRTLFGVMQTVVACSACHGAGAVPEKPCHTCKGEGVARTQETLNIPIPAGIASGETLRVTNQGERAPHGTSGDLYIEIHVEKDAMFARDGHDVVSSAYVPFSVFALGGTIHVETLDGKEKISIDAGTPIGTVVSLRNKGIPYGRSTGRGAHRVTLNAETPKKLSHEQREVLEKMNTLGL